MVTSNKLLKLISNDVAALIEMVGDLQKKTAGESLTNQVKFRCRKPAYWDYLQATPRNRRKLEQIPAE